MTDAERLDFLERTRSPLYIIITQRQQWLSTTDLRPTPLSDFEGWCVGSSPKSHLTVREAIDAAMAAYAAHHPEQNK